MFDRCRWAGVAAIGYALVAAPSCSGTGTSIAVTAVPAARPARASTPESDVHDAQSWVCEGMRQDLAADAPVAAGRLTASLRSEMEGALSRAITQAREPADGRTSPAAPAHTLEWTWELQRCEEGKASSTSASASASGHAAVYFVLARTLDRSGYALARCTERGCLANPLSSERIDTARPGAWFEPVGALDLDRDGRREAVFASGQRGEDVDFGMLTAVEQDGRYRRLELWERAGEGGWRLLDGCALDDDTLLLVGSSWGRTHAGGCAVAVSLTTFEPVPVLGELDTLVPQRPSDERIDLRSLAAKRCGTDPQFATANGTPWLRALNLRITTGDAPTATQAPTAPPRPRPCGIPLPIHTPHIDL